MGRDIGELATHETSAGAQNELRARSSKAETGTGFAPSGGGKKEVAVLWERAKIQLGELADLARAAPDLADRVLARGDFLSAASTNLRRLANASS